MEQVKEPETADPVRSTLNIPSLPALVEAF